MQFSKLELNTLPCPFPVTVPDGRLPFVSDISQGDPLFSSTIQISEGQQYKQPPWLDPGEMARVRRLYVSSPLPALEDTYGVLSLEQHKAGAGGAAQSRDFNPGLTQHGLRPQNLADLQL